ncbi:hypothetical protein ACQUQP_04190 [Marinobacterium sp. YM272]
MDHIFRYVSVVSARETTASAAPAEVQCSGCNYSDNYYGDQVCLAKPSR